VHAAAAVGRVAVVETLLKVITQTTKKPSNWFPQITLFTSQRTPNSFSQNQQIHFPKPLTNQTQKPPNSSSLFLTNQPIHPQTTRITHQATQSFILKCIK